MKKTFCLGLMACLGAMLLSPYVFADPPDWENGDVLIGTPQTDLELDEMGSVDHPLLVAIDTPYQVYAEAGTFIHVAAWAVDGRPAADASVFLSGHHVGQTDETGSFAFRWGVPGNDVESYWLNGSAVEVRWDNGGEQYGGAVWFSAYSRTRSFESDHLFVYTDRGVYSPGQTIRIRSIGWNLAIDYAPLDEAQVEYLLRDPDGSTVAGVDVTTDAFGVASADFDLPEHAVEGTYELTVSYSGATASTRLRVEHFTPPVINIEHTVGRFLTRDQLDLTFEVSLGYFTGGDFTEGTVSIDALVQDASRFHLDREVTDAGPHSFVIDGDALAAIRDGLSEDERIEIRITVVDAYGQSDELTREMRYTANPYIAVIEKDRDYYSTGDSVELIIRLTDRERVPVRETEVTLVSSTGERLTGVTDDGGMVQFTLTMAGTSFNVDVFLADVAVPLATATIPWQALQPMRSHIDDAIVLEDQATHIRVSFPAQFIPSESVVHMDVTDISGSLVNSVLIPITRDGTTYVAEGTFSAPSWGSMLLTFFCLGSDGEYRSEITDEWTPLGLLTEGQNLAVQPNRELEIYLDGIPDELAPGADFSGLVRVTDRDGNPVEAAIGASVVDMSVISLKDPLEITPMDHFYNPELRVISTSGSAILTWPVVSRNWGSGQHDIALPPFPFHPGGTVALGENSRFAEGADEQESDDDDDDDGAYYGLLDTSSSTGGIPEEPVFYAEPDPSPEPLQMLSLGDGRDGEPAVQPEVVITIRTEFPETSLWAPSLYTEDGQTEIAGSVPDSITVQLLTIVASDGHGGVGVLRNPILVTQPLFVLSDLPDTLTVGDQLPARVAVQNLTDTEIEVEVVFSDTQLRLLDGSVRTISIPAYSTGVAQFPLVADRAGRHQYALEARTTSATDRIEQVIWVRPSGAPLITEVSGDLNATSPFVETLDIPIDGQLTTVSLNVVFPAFSAAFAGLDAIQTDLLSSDLMSYGGELIAAALVYDYQRQQGASLSELAGMRVQLEQIRAELVLSQRDDGGWGFWWNSESVPYITGYCLEALLTLQDVDIAVSEDSIRRAVQYLANSWDGEPYDQAAIAFWEGNTDIVQLALTAEIFGVLSRVPANQQTEAWQRTVGEMADLFDGYLDNETPEVLTYAHAVLGLHRLSESSLFDYDREELLEAAQRLNTLRQEGHWEPSWFNAYGGTIEATVAVLQVFHELGGELMEWETRDAVRYLLSTRDEWGGWHNPRGTAAAIRGISILAPAGPEVASTVEVLVDGARVAQVSIDPDDPFLSATELRALDLTQYLDAGSHSVEVRYDGRLEPQVRLTVRHYAGDEQEVATGISLEAELPQTEITLGAPFDYTLNITSTTNATQLVRLDLTAPSCARFERDALQSLSDRGLVDGYQWTDDGLVVFLQLEGEASRDLQFRLLAERPGETSGVQAVGMVLNDPDLGQQPVVALLDGVLTIQ